MLSEKYCSQLNLDNLLPYLESDEAFKNGLRTIAPEPAHLIDTYHLSDMADDALLVGVILYEDYSIIMVGVFALDEDEVFAVAVPASAPSTAEEYKSFIGAMRQHTDFNPPTGAIH